jgi:alkylation response protein AidB-like acyl-CoA dehydrogenase
MWAAFVCLSPSKTHGGDEIDLLSSIDVIEVLSTADGATGWTVMIGCEAPLLACLLPREMFDALYAKGPDVIIGGAFAPQGTAQRVDGGYRVTGRWAFASGCQHCAWLFGNCVVTEQGNPRPGPLEGLPEMRAMLVRADVVEILDTWKVSGLRGTGSHDLAMTDLFVPTAQTFDIFFGQSSVPGPLFKFPLPEFSLHIGAVALGIAAGALEDVTALVKTNKRRLYARASLAETPLVQYRLGNAEVSLRAARALLRAEAESLWCSARESPTDSVVMGTAFNTRILASVAWVVQTCVAIVDTCYSVGGATAIYDTSPLQRRLRDIHTLSQHASVAEGTLTRAGAALIGQPVGFGF